MADSQNTYQNDVKIKSGNSFWKTLVGIIAAVVIGICGYGYVDTEIDKAYEEGYSDAKITEYNKGFNQGKNQGESLGYSRGYSAGYKEAREKYETTNKSSGSSSKNSGNSGKNSNGSNSYSSNNEKEYSYVLNKNTKKFHYSSCHSVKQMADHNKRFHNGTRTEVIEMGYSPCGNCHP